MKSQEIFKYFTCPLSGCIYRDPVICQDGYIYEKEVIENYIKEALINNKITQSYNQNNELTSYIKSPITDQQIELQMTLATQIKENITELIDEFDEKGIKIYKYGTMKPYNMFKESFLNDLINHNFENLQKYVKIKLNDQFTNDQTIGEYLSIQCKNINIIIKILKNSVDLFELNEKSESMIHLLAKNPLMFEIFIIHFGKELLENKITDSLGNTALHYLAKHANFNLFCWDVYTLIKNSNEFNKKGLNPIHIINKRNLPIEYEFYNFHFYVKDYVNLSKKGKYPMYYYCKNTSNFKLLSTIINKYDINNMLSINKKYDVIGLINKNKNLSREEKDKITLDYLSKKNNLLVIQKSMNLKFINNSMSSFFLFLRISKDILFNKN
ncbi:U-box domain protein [Hokovirus HKV1]|uniref:U-box domain protein n=1 Tax=Hokovirus HKV1 TaxID=1977638 RepID=A0A1V0SGW7_9VIRU|nr:U-box domain protein [Hokovirus HKV1]